MANTINMIPEFTSDDQSKGSVQPVIAPTPEEIPLVEEEKETLSESPTEEKPAKEAEAPLSDDTERLQGEVEAIKVERDKALEELKWARGQKRQLKQEEVAKVEQKIDELKDIHPEDEALIDKILKKKGIMTQQEVNQMFYKSVEQDEVRKFLEKFPEYKPENDKDDINWGSLNREFSDYRRPDDPRRIGELLEKAHWAISKPSSDRTLEARRQQVKTASVGGGGVQRSSSQKTLDPDKRAMLLRGGFTKEDIKQMESRLE